MAISNGKTDARLDRPSETAAATVSTGVPWTTAQQRGALDLERDGSQHRRYSSHFEDLLN